MIVWLCWVYDAINNLAPLRVHVAIAHAQGVLRSSGRCTWTPS